MNRSIFKFLAALICVIAFAFGVIRMGVGMVLMTQAVGMIDVAAFSEPIMDIQRFIQEKNGQAIIPLNTVSYLTIIAFMGLCLVVGAIGSWRRRIWGYGALSVYLLAHGSLFVNFQTINPKINILIAGIGMLIILAIVNRFRRD